MACWRRIPLPDAAFALHVMPNARHGLVAGRAGPLLAAADQLDIVVEGRGGHASMPHQTLDPVPVACEIVIAIQTLVTRQFDAFDPVVVTVARIDGGHRAQRDRRPRHAAAPCARSRRATARSCTQRSSSSPCGIAAAHGMARR